MKTAKTSSSNSSLKDRLKKAYTRFLKMRGEPREIALGLAVGLLVGMTPFMGFHIIIAVFLAAIFKWNKITAAIGVQITNVFTAPVIYPVVYMVGQSILGVSSISNIEGYLSVEGVIDLFKHSPLILADLLVGGIILGIPIAVGGYWLCLKAVENYRQKIKPKLAKRRGKKAKKRKKRKK